MKAKFQAEKPKEIEFTMSITMTLDDWIRLKDQLDTNYPSWELSTRIRALIEQANRVFIPEEK